MALNRAESQKLVAEYNDTGETMEALQATSRNLSERYELRKGKVCTLSDAVEKYETAPKEFHTQKGHILSDVPLVFRLSRIIS